MVWKYNKARLDFFNGNKDGHSESGCIVVFFECSKIQAVLKYSIN